MDYSRDMWDVFQAVTHQTDSPHNNMAQIIYKYRVGRFMPKYL